MSEAEFLAQIGGSSDVLALLLRLTGLGWFCGLVGLALAVVRWPR